MTEMGHDIFLRRVRMTLNVSTPQCIPVIASCMETVAGYESMPRLGHLNYKIVYRKPRVCEIGGTFRFTSHRYVVVTPPRVSVYRSPSPRYPYVVAVPLTVADVCRFGTS